MTEEESTHYDEEYIQEPGRAKNARRFLARAEELYLGALRAATLLIASAILLYVTWLLIVGIYNYSRSTSSVVEAPAAVSAQELAEMSLKEPTATDRSNSSQASAETKVDAFYKDYTKRYHAVFQQKFERYRQASDPKLSLSQFDDSYLKTADRRQAIAEGDLDFTQDKDDLNSLLKVVDEASDLPETKANLAKYQSTPKRRVTKQVRRTRTERYCSYYGYYIDECIMYSSRQVPYVENRVSYELPKGIVSYRDLFGRLQDNYLNGLQTKRADNEADALRQRSEILEANERGRSQLQLALIAGASFLALMFFFLLIAIERHQRALARAQSASGSDRS
jgi:hypothetical protein